MLNEFKKRSYFDLAEFVLTLLIAFFFLIDLKIIVYFIALLGLNFIVSGIVKGFQKPKLIFYPFALLFVFYIIGLLFTENFDYGGKDIETRMSFLIFPLFYGARKRTTPINVSWVIWAFTLGAFSYVTVCLFYAYECWSIDYSRFCLESTKLSLGAHPTYIALCLIAGATFVLFDSFSESNRGVKKIIAVAITVVFMYFVYKLYSLGPWIGFAGMFTTLLFAIFYFRKKIQYFFLGLGLLGVIAFFGFKNLELLRSDFDAVSIVLNDYFEDEEAFLIENQNNLGSVNTRIIIWNATVGFIKEHPFGVGTGDVKDELMRYYRSRGMNAFADKKFNPHCQYLQTAGSIGVLGALFLIVSLFYYTFVGFKTRNYFLIALVSLFATASLFESLLERQMGIIFFLFFLTIFIQENTPQKTVENEL